MCTRHSKVCTNHKCFNKDIKAQTRVSLSCTFCNNREQSHKVIAFHKLDFLN